MGDYMSEDCWFRAIKTFWEEVVDPALNAEEIVDMLEGIFDDPEVYEELKYKLGEKAMEFLKEVLLHNLRLAGESKRYEEEFLRG